MADEKIDVRCPREGEWIYVRPGSEYKQVAPLMCEVNKPLHLVADNVVEALRKQGIEPPHERNGMRYFMATLFMVCGRTKPEEEASSVVFIWPIEYGNDNEEALARAATGQWQQYERS